MSENLKTIELQLANPNEALTLFGTNDKHLKQLEHLLNVSIVTRGEHVSVSGTNEQIALVEDILLTVLSIVRKGIDITERDIVYAVDLAKRGKSVSLKPSLKTRLRRMRKGNLFVFKPWDKSTIFKPLNPMTLFLALGRPEQAKHILQWSWQSVH